MADLFSTQLLFAALVTGALYGLTALGLNLVYGTMRLLNVAHGEFVMLGAFAAYWAFTLADIPPLVALPFIVLLSAATGLAIYRGLFRGLLRNPRLAERIESNSLLLFFGLSIVLQNVAAALFTATPRALPYLDSIIRIGDLGMATDRLATLIIAASVTLAIVLFLRFNLFGLAIKALIQNREATLIVGIDVEKVQRTSFALGFGLAGLAGGLVSMLGQISPFMGFPYMITAFVVIILGGLGNLTGGLIAGLLLGVLETYGVALTSTNYRSILIYGVFILILVLRPQGLLGSRRIAR
ncbi:MAG: branched-chain amino acid ABC transporter permease [Dongiaceae bacterium]